jgi:hypothetical protein
MDRHLVTIIGLVAIALLGSGCATVLRPAPEAARTGRADEAVATDAGVQVVVAADAWHGYPVEIDEVITPLLVTLTNDSGRQLELRHELLGLVTPGGVLYAAVPPFDVRGVVYQPIDAAYPAGGFTPYYSPWYPGWGVSGGPYRPYSYGGFYSTVERVSLPSGDMVEEALDEGILAPGGRVTGFVFFERIEDVRRVTFSMRLVDAKTGEQFGAVAIPFVVERRACKG